MEKQTQTAKPRIFISHAWEDKPLVRRLEAKLQAAGAEVWVDHVGIRGGDNLPERISDALEWCNTLLLIWSDAARKSDWVKEEWTNAKSLKRVIIPCLLNKAPLPAILASTAYVDFRNNDYGIAQLLHALNLARQATVLASISPTEQVARVLHNQLTESTTPAKAKPPQIVLRAKLLENLSTDDVQRMLKEKNFYARDWNPSGKGLRHEYETMERQSKKLIIDHTTGLMWQQSGSSKRLTYKDARKHIRDLNANLLDDYSDWRLPTLEEAMSLMESKEHGDLYLDPVFDRAQWWVWTADKASDSHAWVVHFDDGSCGYDGLVDFDGIFVRAVKTIDQLGS